MSLRLPAATPPQSREMAVQKADGLHDAALHVDMLGADDTRVIWLRPARPIKVTVRT
jgi:hypothetical protein